MRNYKPKIFISYTIRDEIINVDFLLNIERRINAIGSPFIDLLHNDSLNKQARVFNELMNSDIFILLKTKEILNSEWVEKEISLANKIKIPIFEFEYEQLIKENFQFITIATSNTPLTYKNENKITP